ncbi:hypothetical protein B0H13DRAFT_1868239 [Mycena leptocephala]|nr:hypothetical protein B0H13DRAFT_1868239 [Mycena leptocephala]
MCSDTDEVELSVYALDGVHSERSVVPQMAKIDRRVLLMIAHRLSLFESAEWASTALDMLHSIRADVHSHLPDLPSLDLLSLDFDLSQDRCKTRDTATAQILGSGCVCVALSLDFDYFKEKLKSRLSNVKGLDFDFSSPLSYVPTRLRSLHAHLAAELPCFEFQFRRPGFGFSAPPLLRELLDAFHVDVDAFLAELPSLQCPRPSPCPPYRAPRSLPCPSSITTMHTGTGMTTRPTGSRKRKSQAQPPPTRSNARIS